MSNNSLSEANVYTSDYLGNMLHLTGVMYFSQLDITTQAMAERNDIHCENTLRFGIVGFKPSVYTGASWVEGQKDGIQKEGQYFVDILSNTVMPFSKTGEQSAVRAFNFNRGFSSSELESTVLEEVLNVESLSTAALFRYAQENDIPLVTLSATSETKVSELNVSSDDITLIQAEIDEGNTVVTMQSSVTLENWNGIGYIVISPDGSTQEYMISGGYSGGITFDLVGLYYTINVALDLALICESVVVLTGILATMSSLAIVPVALVLLSVVSIELLAFDILEQSFLYYEYMFEDDAEAGMEIWLSTATNSTLTLLTMGIGKAISTVSTHVAGARLASAYGSSTINNIKNAGFTTAEINSKVKFFKSLGLTQNTINTLLKDAKCMFLGDDFTAQIIKIASQYGDDVGGIIGHYGTESINIINNLGQSAIDTYKFMDDIAVRYADDVMNYSYQSGNYTPTIETLDNWEQLDKTAKEMYTYFRTQTDDIAKVVDNTGWSYDDIAQIKQYVFNQEVLLDDGYSLFDPSYEMAVAWERLINGNYFDCDILLLKHELYESTYYMMYHKELGVSQRIAHEATTKVFDWNKLIEYLKSLV